ncbi:MAG: prepilin-type N-terminal cleavage/methylation domain-containing protein [Gemmatimonadota bacterium]
MAAHAPSRPDPGFTLVELLVALVLSGLVGTAVVALLLGQGLFLRRTHNLALADQRLRAAADLMGSELREASAGDLVAAEPDSLTVRFTVRRSIVCDSAVGGVVRVFVYDSLSGPNLRGGIAGTAVLPPDDTTWARADGFAPALDRMGSAPRAACAARGAPATGAASSYRTLSGWRSALPGRLPPGGSLIRAYGTLTYRLAPSRFSAGVALWRDRQELVPSFAAGATFRYVLEDASVVASVPPGALADVRAVRFVATATAGRGRAIVRRSLAYDIPFRN